MIKKILTYCAEQLNSYLGRYYHRPQGLAEVGHIGQRTGEIPNKVIVSLVNVERETAGGISNNVQTYGGSFFAVDGLDTFCHNDDGVGFSFFQSFDNGVADVVDIIG